MYKEREKGKERKSFKSSNREEGSGEEGKGKEGKQMKEDKRKGGSVDDERR